MFKVFGYDCDFVDFEFYVNTEEEAKKCEKDLVMCVVFYEEADSDVQQIVHIGKKVGVKFESGKSIYSILNKVMDRLEGKSVYADDYLFCLNYKNELMSDPNY